MRYGILITRDLLSIPFSFAFICIQAVAISQYIGDMLPTLFWIDCLQLGQSIHKLLKVVVHVIIIDQRN